MTTSLDAQKTHMLQVNNVTLPLDVPSLGAGWIIDTPVSLPNESILLYLKRPDNFAFWLCDREGKFVTGDRDAIVEELKRNILVASDAADLGRLNEIAALTYLSVGDYSKAAAFLQTINADEPLFGPDLLISATQTAFNCGLVGEIEELIAKVPAAPEDRKAVLAAYQGRVHADGGDWEAGQAALSTAVQTSDSLPSWTLSYLSYCARQATGTPPEAMMPELQRFGEAADAFFRGENINWKVGRFPAEALAYHWIRTFKFIDVEADIGEKIKNYALAPAFITALQTGSAGVSRLIGESIQLPVVKTPYSERVRDIAAGIKGGGKPVLCPFTGQIRICRDTIDQHVFLLRHVNRLVVILSDRKISNHPSDQFWVFPAEKLFLCSDRDVEAERDLAVSMARVVANAGDVLDYLSAPERQSMVAETSMGHIGHYVWNIISAWEPLFQLVSPSKIDAIVTHRSSHFFGGVSELYRDEISKSKALFVVEDDHHLFKVMLETRSTLFAIRDTYITQRLADRIRHWCKNNTSLEFKDDLSNFVDGTGPVLMITVRTGNRSWVNQVEGYIHLISTLKHQFPGLKIVIDGLNAPPAGTSTALPMSIDAELDIAKAITEACPDVKILNSIGCTVAESILFAYACDAFVSPVGAGLAKVRWIANKPGVGFSNLTFMEPDNFGGHLYSHFRENQTDMRYVGVQHIQDLDDGPNGLKNRANFNISLTEIVKLTAEVLESVCRSGKTIEINGIE